MINFIEVGLFANSTFVNENFGDWVDFLKDKQRLDDEFELWKKLKLPEYEYESLADSLQAVVIGELEEIFDEVTEFDYQINGLATSLTIADLYNPSKNDLESLYDKLVWAKNYYEPSV